MDIDLIVASLLVRRAFRHALPHLNDPAQPYIICLIGGAAMTTSLPV
jgi:hypothetical protein